MPGMADVLEDRGFLHHARGHARLPAQLRVHDLDRGAARQHDVLGLVDAFPCRRDRSRFTSRYEPTTRSGPSSTAGSEVMHGLFVQEPCRETRSASLRSGGGDRGGIGILPRCRGRREGQWEARAPQNRAGQHHPEGAHEIELKVEDQVAGNRRIDRPERQRRIRLIARPRERQAQAELTPAQRRTGHWRRCEPAPTPACCRCRGQPGRPRGSARTCTWWRRTAATARASTGPRSPAP